MAKLFPKKIRNVLSRNLVTRILSEDIRIFFKFLENLIPSSQIIENTIKEISPEIVIVSPGNMRFRNKLNI